MFGVFNPYSGNAHCFHLGPYFAEDDGKGGGGGGGGDDEEEDDADDETADDGKQAKTLTQAAANKLIGEARRKGGKTAVTTLLTKLGVTTEDELTTLITTAKEAGKAGKTQLEKLQLDLDEAKKTADTAKAESEKKAAATTERLLRVAIKEAALKATLDEKTKKVLRGAFKNDPKILEIIYDKIDRKIITLPDDDDPDSDFQGIEKALTKLAKDYSVLLETGTTQTSRGTGLGPRERLQDQNQNQQQNPPARRVKSL